MVALFVDPFSAVRPLAPPPTHPPYVLLNEVSPHPILLPPAVPGAGGLSSAVQ